MWFQMQFIKTTSISKPHVSFIYELRHFKMSFAWHYKVIYSSLMLVHWGTELLVKISAWSKVTNVVNLYVVGTAWYVQGNRTYVSWPSAAQTHSDSCCSSVLLCQQSTDIASMFGVCCKPPIQFQLKKLLKMLKCRMNIWCVAVTE